MFSKTMILILLSAGGFLQEESELTKLKKQFLKAEKEVRSEVLTKIFELSPGKDEEPSLEVTHALALGLQDKDINVRIKAVRLIGQGQHPDVAVPGLIKLLKNFKKDKRKFDKEEYKSKKHIFEGDDFGKASMEMLMIGLMSSLYGTKLIESIGNYRDDRAEKALIAFIKDRNALKELIMQREESCQVLVRYGTKTSLEAVIKLTSRLEQLIRTRTKRKDKRGTSLFKKWMNNNLDSLDAAADAAHLPCAEARTAKSWNVWINQYGKKLPKNLSVSKSGK